MGYHHGILGLLSSALFSLVITLTACIVSEGFVITRKSNDILVEVPNSSFMKSPRIRSGLNPNKGFVNVDSSPSSMHMGSSSFMDQISNFFPMDGFQIKNKNEEEDNDDITTNEARESMKTLLLELIESTPQNAATSKELTQQILEQVADLEGFCPTPNENVLTELAGNWQLLWTAQDKSSLSNDGKTENRLFGTWINPLENQSYSNNPEKKSKSISNDDEVSTGRSNPILPRNIQDRLEQIGILEVATTDNSMSNGGNDKNNNVDSVVKSSQAIDLKRKRVRNVVSVQFPRPLLGKKKLSGSLTVDVQFQPDETDSRKINVKFKSCRVNLQNSPLDVTIPLGPVGPTGWLRTAYVDETIRITRGHKGSVFILSRTVKRKKSSLKE